MIFAKLLMIIILLRLKETYSTAGQQGMNSSDRPSLKISTMSGPQASTNDIWDPTTVMSTDYNNITKTNMEFTISPTPRTKQNTRRQRIPAETKNNFSQVYVIFSAIFIVIGILLNIVNLIVNTKLESILFSIYLKSIAISDLLYLISAAFNFLAFDRAFNKHYDSDKVMVQLWFYNTRSLVLFQYVSALILFYIGLERAIRVNYPLISMTWFGRKKAKITVLVLSILACILVTPYFFTVQFVQYKMGDNNVIWFTQASVFSKSEVGKRLYLALNIIFRYGIIAAFMIINFLILLGLIRQRRNRAKLFATAQSPQLEKQRRRELSQYYILVCIVILFSIPNSLSIISLLTSVSRETLELLRNLRNILFLFNSTACFFLYCLSSVDYREVLLKLIIRCVTCHG